MLSLCLLREVSEAMFHCILNKYLNFLYSCLKTKYFITYIEVTVMQIPLITFNVLKVKGVLEIYYKR